MLESHERPIFLAACACNFAFAITGALAIETQAPVAGAIAVFGGAAAFLIAEILGIRILRHDGGMYRKWVKAGLVFLVLGPLGFWGLQWPAMVDTICIAGHRCYSEAALAFHARAIGDVIQSQLAMIAVAAAALMCAARALSVTLDELAL
jgi:hypothetical protein